MRSANILAEVTNDILHQVMLGKQGTLRIHRNKLLKPYTQMTSANMSAEVTNDILHGVLLFLVLKSTRMHF